MTKDGIPPPQNSVILPSLETGENNKQQYDVKILRAFHKQAMIKQQIFENIIAGRSGMDYSPGIQFQMSIINMYKAKALIMNNQPRKPTDKKNGAGVAHWSTYISPQRNLL